jgi:hypothetical protein
MVMTNVANVEIRIRQHNDSPACAVIVTARDREMIIQLPDYDKAVKWAEMECRSYRVQPTFPVEAIENSNPSRRPKTKL